MTTILTDDPVKPLVVGMSTAQALLDTGLDSLYRLIKAKELDSYLEGKRRKITMESIERLIEKRLTTATIESEYRERMRALRIKPRVRPRAGQAGRKPKRDKRRTT
jgi:hypothetical protein